MSLAAQELMRAEDFWRIAEDGVRRELIAGEVVERMPPGGIHGIIAVRMALVLGRWLDQHGLGIVGVESGFVLRRNPDTVRSPDVYVVRAERIPATGVPEAFWDIPPDLAIEVVSPSESAEDVREKVRDFLMGGTSMVWVVYPRSREVVVHLPDGTARTYSDGTVLTAPSVLPGFSCAVADLFG